MPPSYGPTNRDVRLSMLNGLEEASYQLGRVGALLPPCSHVTWAEAHDVVVARRRALVDRLLLVTQAAAPRYVQAMDPAPCHHPADLLERTDGGRYHCALCGRLLTLDDLLHS